MQIENVNDKKSKSRFGFDMTIPYYSNLIKAVQSTTTYDNDNIRNDIWNITYRCTRFNSQYFFNTSGLAIFWEFQQKKTFDKDSKSNSRMELCNICFRKLKWSQMIMRHNVDREPTKFFHLIHITAWNNLNGWTLSQEKCGQFSSNREIAKSTSSEFNKRVVVF